ncbi:MAG TPA: SDR family oxidoreductase [Candidatus Acidoferrum sp.]|nr:SDR family oxidoreductase [Candidatus Acidoferrum sp.]
MNTPLLRDTVLITGASSGIGLELARCFAGDGSRLVLLARNTAALEALAAELRRVHGIEAIVLTADLSLPETPAQVFQELQGRGIQVDVLVNNAGFGASGDFADLPLSRQLEIIQVNIGALTALTGWFLPAMIKRKRGGILNVGSVAGFLPGPGMAVYFATKAFVGSFSQAVAEEVAGMGVTVTALCPGPTESNFGTVARGPKSRAIRTGKMTAAEVARHGHRAFRQGKRMAISGWRNRLIVLLIWILPRSVVLRLTRFFNQTR